MKSCIAYATTKHSREFVETQEDQTEWSGKWEEKIMYYDVIGECRTMTEREVRKALNLAMTTWDIEVDIVFKPVWYSEFDTANLTIDFKDAKDDDLFKTSPSVLAYAYFPSQGSVSGKVVFNNDYIWTVHGRPISGFKAKDNGWINPDTSDFSNIKTYNIITVLIHELGHSLGLRHDVTGASDGDDAMDAFYDGNLNLSDRDVFRILLKYPARVYSRFNHYGRLKRWLARKKQRLQQG